MLACAPMAKPVAASIITCVRPDRVARCAASVQAHAPDICDLFVFESGGSSGLDRLRDSGIAVRGESDAQLRGPSAARVAVSELSEAPYVLFLDDDVCVSSGSIQRLLRHLEEKPEIAVATPAFKEYGSYRELGAYFHKGTDGAQEIVWRRFLSVSDARAMNLTSARVDLGSVGAFLVRRSALAISNFDPNYGFFFELADFFMQYQHAGLAVSALPDAEFIHRPGPYSAPSMRKLAALEDDQRRFEEKWKIRHVGPLGPPLPPHRRLLSRVVRLMDA